MRKLIEKLQTKIILWSPESQRQKNVKSLLIKITDYVLYPEFRDPKLTKRVRAIFYTPLIATVCLFVFLKMSSHTRVMASAYSFLGIESDSLIFNADTDYELLKGIVSEESGIDIPEHVPYDHVKLMYDQCQEKDVPVSIFFRLVYFESRFDSTATSRAGAKGYCQIMPTTFKMWYEKMKLKGGKTVENNIKISVQLLSDLERNFVQYDERKKWELVLSSYNAGIGRVINAGYNIPNIRETKGYVRNILSDIEI
jgi:uncharacterized protein YggT (Ycf19 family)